MAALVALVALIGAPAASAQVTVGQTTPPGPTPELCDFGGPFDEIQSSVSSGNSYVIPAAGVLTSWSTNTGLAPGQVLGMKVFRRTGALTYLVVGQDAPRPLAPSLLNTFPVSIPVLAGDRLGISLPAGAKANCDFETGDVGDEIRYAEGNVAPGGTVTFSTAETKSRLNVSATLLEPPTIASIGPAAGSVTGGAKVVITGANFALVSAVSFGATPAKSFTVDSETQITAIAPKSSKLIKVAVGVTTAAGLAGAPTTFAYEGCRVPKLKDKRLKAVKKQAKKADCRIGKVKKLGDATAKTGEVVKQNPPPGKILAPGTKIKVTLDE
jgi:hypothetical protein